MCLFHNSINYKIPLYLRWFSNYITHFIEVKIDYVVRNMYDLLHLISVLQAEWLQFLRGEGQTFPKLRINHIIFRGEFVDLSRRIKATNKFYQDYI